MRTTLLIHVVAGGLGLLSGYVALYSAKDASLHRKAGMVFVYAMLTMCAFGVLVAASEGVAPALNVPAGLLTGYLVMTSLTTVKPPARGGRALSILAMLLALAVGLVSLAFGFEAIANGGKRDGLPAFPFFLFGLVGVLGGAGDLRALRSGALRGARRLARHLWRMSFALFVAAMSFFLGQADAIPEPLRAAPLRALPVLAVLVTMLYWLWRVRRRRRGPGVVERAGSEPLPARRAA